MKAKNIAMAIVLVIFLLIRCLAANAQTFTSTTVSISFFSSTPIEDIRAASKKASAAIVTKNGSFAFQVPIKSFEFEKRLMQEHFNENYLESEQFPIASFNGNILSDINWTKDGEYNIIAKGLLTIHGVSKLRTIPAKTVLKNGTLHITSSFEVACSDHNIQIPTLVFTKIAKIIAVNIDGTLSLKP